MKAEKQLSAKILVIEDDKNLNYFIKKILEQNNFDVTVASDGESGAKRALSNKFDLFIVDIGLPVLNGFQVVKKIRNKGIKTPIIIVTNDSTTVTEKETFLQGANLFHKKPMDFDLLIAQVTSILSINSIESTFEIGDLFIDVKKRLVQKKGRDLHLSYKEFELLISLIAGHGDVLTRTELINHTMKGIKDVEEGSIDTLVSRVRKKIGKVNGEDIIETIHGVGFRLNLNYLGQK